MPAEQNGARNSAMHCVRKVTSHDQSEHRPTLAIRIVLVLLFLPFSALDKILNFRGAVARRAR